MTDFENWAQKPEMKARLASAKNNAWEQFTKQFPNADKNQFQVETRVDEKYRITSEVFFNESEGSSVSVFGSDRKYWSQKMKCPWFGRYQLAVDEAKVRLNLAVCPGAWLMPARMIINMESIVGYNNKLKQAQAGMKLGMDNSVNLGTKKISTTADGWRALKNKPS